MRKEFVLSSNPKEKHDNIQNPSQSKESSDCLEKNKSNALDISTLLKMVQELEEKTFYLIESLREESQDKAKLEIELRAIKKERNSLSSDLQKLLSLPSMEPRNVNKRVNRQKDNNRELNQKLKHCNKEIKGLQNDNEDLDSKLKKVLKSNSRSRKSLCVWKKKARALLFEQENSEEETVFQSYVQDLKDQIEYLEDEKLKLEEKINSFLKDREVQVFQEGKYCDEVRQVYEDLLCYGLGSRNIEPVIRTVLKKLAGLDAGRLPKASFAKYMLLEARTLAQLQIADELSGGGNDIPVESNNTLQSDGTSKQKRSFQTYGVWESATSDAKTQLDVFLEVLSDIGQLNNNSNFVNQTIASIKNLMSDRCNTQKCFNNMFITLRETILPKVEELWDSLSQEERTSLSKINQFFCGLHFLVALADQADTSLKIWENLCFPDGKVGSKQFSNYQKASNNGESGTTRTVRTSCKLVQSTQGCEKSGKMLKFSTWLKEEKNIDSVPLYPFLGNRFNILFLNGGGLFKIYDHLITFLEGLDKDNENQLVVAVKRDLKVRNFKVGCRALGLINKLVTETKLRDRSYEYPRVDFAHA